MTIASASQMIERLAGAACLLALAGAGVFCAWDMHQTQIELRGTIAEIHTSTGALNQSLERMPSVIDHADRAFGNLADATGDWSDASKQQARDVRALLAASGRAVDGLTEDTRAAKGTLDAATELTRALTKDAGTANEAIASTQPLLEASARSVEHLDALIQSQDLRATIANVENITAESQAIAGDARRVADDATRRYFQPTPWYRKAFPFLTTGAKIASYALPW